MALNTPTLKDIWNLLVGVNPKKLGMQLNILEMLNYRKYLWDWDAAEKIS